jgi:hypothetical protein
MSSARAGHGHHRWPRVPAQSEVDLDMFRALVLNGVGGEVDGADVVTVDECALHQRSVELLK